jgi:hypothetical protein
LHDEAKILEHTKEGRVDNLCGIRALKSQSDAGVKGAEEADLRSCAGRNVASEPTDNDSQSEANRHGSDDVDNSERLDNGDNEPSTFFESARGFVAFLFQIRVGGGRIRAIVHAFFENGHDGTVTDIVEL